MQDHYIQAMVPDYKGLEWQGQGLELPTQISHWQTQEALDLEQHEIYAYKARQASHAWRWPKRDIAVFTDLHADGHAFVNSLIASGYIKKFGPDDSDFMLTKKGRKCHFIINGDCFDKGPSNLNLLRLIHQLRQQKAKVKIIAGNHDIRFLVGLSALDNQDNPLYSHLFIRMAPKGVSFFKEIYETYIAHLSDQERLELGEGLDETAIRNHLYPDANWPEQFRIHAKGQIKDAKIQKEIEDVQKKQKRFESQCAKFELSLPMAFAAINYWKKLFLEKKGEFSWFYRKMKLLHTSGSFLFVHAGIDDVMAHKLKNKGAKALNRKFHQALKKDLFKLYYGHMGNMFRTKYRLSDHDFTKSGAKTLKTAGYYAIVQGHCNRHEGQQLVNRYGLLNFECDASLDEQTRLKEGLSGRGAATTLIRSSGAVLGISVDYPYVKAYTPHMNTK